MSRRCVNDLSTELIIYIFSFLELRDLGRLRCTCRRFRDIINCWDNILLKTATIVSNQNSEKFLTRLILYLSNT